MTEKKENGESRKKELDPESRFRFVGFEVYQGRKVKDLFTSETEKEKWVEKVREKRGKSGRIREHNQFDVPRVAGYEKIVLTIISLVLIGSLFLPWFSGYSEYEVVAAPAEPAPVDSALTDSMAVDPLLGTAEVATTDSFFVDDTVVAETAAESPEEALPGGAPETEVLEEDEAGFASITAIRKRKEIRKEHVSYSAIGALGLLASDGGKIFSSGPVVIITVLLFLLYMVLCVLSAIYTVYVVLGGKKDPDQRALQLKRSLRINWLPLGIWIFCLVISFAGSAYSFDTADMIKQIGTSYGTGTYLGILSYGFYISLAAFLMNAVKAVEI